MAGSLPEYWRFEDHRQSDLNFYNRLFRYLHFIRKNDALHYTRFSGVGSMDEVIDQIMDSTEVNVFHNDQNRAEIKTRVGNYIATLSSAGRDDADQLIEYGVAYLRNLREGPDPRYTGC